MIEGEGGMGIGAGGGAATILRWAANTTGIRIQYVTTSGAETVESMHYSGGFTTLKQLYLAGPAAGGGLLSPLGLLEGEHHGIHVKATCFLDNVQVEGFQGDALYAHTTSGGGAPDEGASNCSRAYNCTFRNSRNGVSLSGGDANAWLFIGCNFLYNRACGVDDRSFLGNSYIHPHTNGNGITADNLGTSDLPAYVVSNGGNRYCPVQGQETAAATTAPAGTADTSVWLYLGAGGTGEGVPAWTSGMPLRCGAPYRTNNFNAPNRFYNPYEEGGQGFSQFTYPTVVDGGVHGQGIPKGSGVYVGNYFGQMLVPAGVTTIDPSTNIGFVLAQNRLEADHPTGGQQSLEWSNNDLVWTYARGIGNSSLWSFRLLGEGTTCPVGKRRIEFTNGFGFASLKVFPGTAAPTSGAYVRGDRIINTAPAAGGNMGWICVAGGSPGTWKSFGAIAA
jgi:hypothetical protein